MRWERSGLETEGFLGFTPFAALPTAGVPVGAGVYVVYRDSDEPPRLLERSSGGHFKGKEPDRASGSAPVGVGDGRSWYRRFGAGEPIAHWGGRYIWQMSDSPALLVAWRETSLEDPRLVEQAYIAEFVRHYGQRPFANLTD